MDSWCCPYYRFMVLWIIKAKRIPMSHLVQPPYFIMENSVPKRREVTIDHNEAATLFLFCLS